MISEEISEVSRQARLYKIKCKTERIGTGEDFEYKISFDNGIEFKDGRAASMFIDAIVREHKLTEHTKPYRVGFGWEIY